MKRNQVNIIELLPGLRGRACVLFPPFAGCDNYSHPNGLKWWNPPKLGLARTKKYGFNRLTFQPTAQVDFYSAPNGPQYIKNIIYLPRQPVDGCACSSESWYRRAAIWLHTQTYLHLLSWYVRSLRLLEIIGEKNNRPAPRKNWRLFLLLDKLFCRSG